MSQQGIRLAANAVYLLQGHYVLVLFTTFNETDAVLILCLVENGELTFGKLVRIKISPLKTEYGGAEWQKRGATTYNKNRR